MSGVKRLANAVANDPSFMSKIKGISKQELAEFVQPDQKAGPKSKGVQTGKY